jgi:transposase InsO family protein
MPKIEWTNLPDAIRKHLLLRLKEREITEDDLYRLKLWRDMEPEAPEGPWYKDFSSFKICGEGRYPKTFLLKGQTATGERLE